MQLPRFKLPLPIILKLLLTLQVEPHLAKFVQSLLLLALLLFVALNEARHFVFNRLFLFFDHISHVFEFFVECGFDCVYLLLEH